MISQNGLNEDRIAKRAEAIDKLLSGRNDAIRLNVLDYMVKYGIDPENEFFIIFIALGELETLIENSPKEWQDVFKSFEGELKKWADTNLETLQHLSQKASITERLASNSESLSNSLIKFLDICEGLMSQLQKSNGLLTNSISQLQTSLIELKNLVENQGKLLSQLESRFNQLPSQQQLPQPSNPPNLKKKKTWKDNVILALVVVLLSSSLYFNFNQRQINQDTNQRVQWLLKKANRQDCLAGIKKRDSPECQGLGL
ncbi:MAG: hypothetical protein QNJ70_20715 [Xenococcaceae cyanobacterium MO_207.B15]|nr:hypothetical protein [Xenococcaceae cyanobacterium MO_207.B15]